METAQTVGESVLPIIFDDLPREISIGLESQFYVLVTHSPYISSLHGGTG